MKICHFIPYHLSFYLSYFLDLFAASTGSVPCPFVLRLKKLSNFTFLRLLAMEVC